MMASELENSVLVRALECSICYARYGEGNPPRILRCRHSFCQNCIVQLVRGCCSRCCRYLGSCISTTATKLYNTIDRVLDIIQERHRFWWLLVFTVYGIISALIKVYEGATNCTSACPLEKMLARCLLAKGCLAAFFWVPWILILFNRHSDRAWKNTFIVAYTIFDTVATCGLLIFGTVFAMGYFGKMKEVCPTYVEHWNDVFATIALVVTAVDWFGVAVFLYFSCYVACDNPDY